MKRFCLFAFALMLVAPLGQAQTKLKWAHVYEAGEPYHKWSVWAAGEIEKRSSGRYHIDVYPASQLGKEADINQGLTLGTVDIILSGSSFQARDYAPLAVTYFPFVFREPSHVFAYAKSPIYRNLADGYEKVTGNHIVALTYYGARHVTSNKPIAKPEDMKGLKIRVPDAPAYLAFPKALGANPTPIAFAEVYLALQNGTVEAEENPLTTIRAKKFYEVQKYINLTGHIYDSLNTIVSGGLWKKLSDDDKKMFTEVMQQASQSAGQEIAEQEKTLADWFKSQNVQVLTVDRDAFRAVVLKNAKPEDFGYKRADYDAIQALK
jgi:tripartite ATP-independent transporter DctP family solute receptor